MTLVVFVGPYVYAALFLISRASTRGGAGADIDSPAICCCCCIARVCGLIDTYCAGADNALPKRPTLALFGELDGEPPVERVPDE